MSPAASPVGVPAGVAVEAVSRAFRDTYAREPEGVWAAPGRVNLIGEHTDYTGGFVLPFALPQRTLAAVARRGDTVLRVASRQEEGAVEVPLADLAPGAVTGWGSYVAGVVWALRESGHEVGGLDVLVDGDVPLGAGLSSSASLECAVALAVRDLAGLDVDDATLAGLAQRAENDFVGMPCGVMDQAAALRCRAGHALFLDTRDLSVAHVPLALDTAGLALLVVDTRAPHRLVDGEYAARRRTCEEATATLGVASLRDLEPDALAETLARLDDEGARRRVRHVVTENARVLAAVAALREGRLRDVGPLLTASHASMRDDYEITVPEVDVAVESALDAGALGARMTGGGFGGCVLALVDAETTGHVAEAVARAFAARGFSPPAPFVAVASAGAQRLA